MDVKGLAQLMVQDFALREGKYISREMLQEALKLKVEQMMDKEMEALLSKLYRLDIFENKIKAVFAEGGDIAMKIAGLIIDRQLEKEFSKQMHRAEKPDDDELAW